MSFSSLLSLPLDILSTENIMHDGMCGFVIVISTLCFFIAIVWLREQIVHGGAPEWLEPPLPPRRNPPNRGPGGAGEHQDFYLYAEEEEEEAGEEEDDEEDANEDQRVIEENGNDIAAAQLAAQQRANRADTGDVGDAQDGPVHRGLVAVRLRTDRRSYRALVIGMTAPFFYFLFM